MIIPIQILVNCDSKIFQVFNVSKLQKGIQLRVSSNHYFQFTGVYSQFVIIGTTKWHCEGHKLFNILCNSKGILESQYLSITMFSASNVICAVFQDIFLKKFQLLILVTFFFIFLFQYRKKTRLDLALCTSLNSRS